MEQTGGAGSASLRREHPAAPLPRSFAAVAAELGSKGNAPHSLSRASPQIGSAPRQSVPHPQSRPISLAKASRPQKKEHTKQKPSLTPGKRRLVSTLGREGRSPRIPREAVSEPHVDAFSMAGGGSIWQHSTPARAPKQDPALSSRRPAPQITPERLLSFHNSRTEPAINLTLRLPPSETFSLISRPPIPARIPS